jgi:zinc and cadmium transporter
MNIWVGTFISVTIVSLISLIGVFFLALRPDKLRRIQLVLVGLATGGLLGGAFIHLIPEAFESFKNQHTASILLVAGFLLFFILERFLHWQHNHTEGISSNHIKPFGPINLIADMFHNFLDGILIGAAFLYSPEIGITTTIIVLLHEIPQEIGDFGILIHAGYTPRKALFYNFASACSSYIGAFIVLIFSTSADLLSKAVLPIAAGGFIYLAAADLIPELHTEKNLKSSIYQFGAILFGIGVLFLLLLLKK